MKSKNYRPNVAAVILSPKYPRVCEFFLGERRDMKKIWQFPQGGIDEGESPRDALFRELREEIGTDEVEVVAECPYWVSYDFPAAVMKENPYPYDGQIQKYFLVRLKRESIVDIHTQHPEFSRYKFVSYSMLFSWIHHFKRDVYREILTYFKKEGFIG